VPAQFEPFRSGDSPGSVGLGLFIVSEIARLTSGNVSVRLGEDVTTVPWCSPRARVRDRRSDRCRVARRRACLPVPAQSDGVYAPM
jgi:hypothetical protein